MNVEIFKLFKILPYFHFSNILENMHMVKVAFIMPYRGNKKQI